jgi:hypothetical protein
MATFDAKALVRRMSGAAAESLGGRWPEAAAYAELEFAKFADTVLLIRRLKAARKITRARAKAHLDIQRNAMRTVLLTVEGLGQLAAEAALNAALDAVRATVNAAVGWRIL